MLLNNEPQWDAIVKLMQQCKWRDNAALNDAFNAMFTAWSRGDDPNMLALVATNFGQVSGYTGKVMETMADAVAHEEMHLKTQPLPVLPVAAPAEPDAVLTTPMLAPGEKDNAWRNAVEQRKVMLGAAKEELNVQIKTLRETYGELEKQWDEYVAATRELNRKLK